MIPTVPGCIVAGPKRHHGVWDTTFAVVVHASMVKVHIPLPSTFRHCRQPSRHTCLREQSRGTPAGYHPAYGAPGTLTFEEIRWEELLPRGFTGAGMRHEQCDGTSTDLAMISAVFTG